MKAMLCGDDDGVVGEVVLRRQWYRRRLTWYAQGTVELGDERCRWYARVSPMTTKEDCEYSDVDVDAILRDSAQVDAMLEDMVRNSAQAQREALDVIAALDADVDAALRQLRDS